MDFSADDARYMAQAIRLAERGRYTTHPNPCVGAVIVKDGQVIGEGFHLLAGEAHAEALALAEAGARARGATVYCTLEPCSFVGRTPSCAQALIDAGVARVVAAMADPHSRNAGAGFQMLRQAGIEVAFPFMESSVRAINRGHIKRYESGLPFVRLKLAMSLDGRTAPAKGASGWITAIESRRDVQKLRAESSVIVTGVQTVNVDNPRLTVRADELDIDAASMSASLTRPVVILDPTGRVRADAGLLQQESTLLVTAEDVKVPPARAEQIAMPTGTGGRIQLEPLLRMLAARDLHDVLFECGATLAGSLVTAGLVDEIVIYTAPVILGGDAPGLLNIPKIDSMQHRIEWQLIDLRKFGDDLRLIFQPKSG